VGGISISPFLFFGKIKVPSENVGHRPEYRLLCAAMACTLFSLLAALEPSDVIKLLGIVAAAVFLFLIARRIGGGGETIAAPAESMLQPAPEIEAAVESASEAAGPDPDQPDYEPPPSEDAPGPPPRNIRIVQWNFAKFDIASGPPDRNAFADDLHMQLFDPSTGRRWMQTYFVATPGGLQKMLADNRWNYMLVPQMWILDRYDLNELRAAMLEELGAMEVQRGEASAHEEER
jgi:hypothetical protein